MYCVTADYQLIKSSEPFMTGAEQDTSQGSSNQYLEELGDAVRLWRHYSGFHE